MICPNLSNPEIKKEFDELVQNLGKDLAYLVWNRNAGHFVDKTKEGLPSILFNDLLNSTNRNTAIKLKAATLSNSFVSWFESGTVDSNGEPKLINRDGVIGFTAANQFKPIDVKVNDTKEIVSKENRQQTNIYGSMVDNIMERFETFFPSLTYYNDEQRRIVAEQVNNGTIQITCKF